MLQGIQTRVVLDMETLQQTGRWYIWPINWQSARGRTSGNFRALAFPKVSVRTDIPPESQKRLFHALLSAADGKRLGIYS
jgi:hypothetical protein